MKRNVIKTWNIYGHERGKKERNQWLGSVKAYSHYEALRMSKYEQRRFFPEYVITKIIINRVSGG